MAKKQDNTEQEIETVKMVRDGFFADVHPDEVENYSKVGFSVVE